MMKNYQALKRIRIHTDSMQIREGLEYHGSVNFDDIGFNYCLQFNPGLKIFERYSPDINFNRRLQNIGLKVSDCRGKLIPEPTKSVKSIFYASTVELAVNLYKNPVRKLIQQQLDQKLSEESENLGRLIDLASGIVIIGHSEGVIDRTPDLEKFLREFRKY